MYKLISALPSPFARKVRIALLEKGIPFQLQTEMPWESTTTIPTYNPLEKLPVLVPEDGRPAIYDSRFIMEWLEVKHPDPPLMPTITDDQLFARQVEVVTDGACDAYLMALFENKRGEDKRSQLWEDRQMRKVNGGLKALASWVKDADGEPLIRGRFGHADIAAGSLLGYLNHRAPELKWKQQYPHLAEYWERLEERESFKASVPRTHAFKEPVV